MAVDFLRSEMSIPVSQLLPYPVVLVPLAYFFHEIKNKKASSAQKLLLEQYFYWAGLNGRYSSAAESKIAEDLKKMIDIAKGKGPKYPRDELQINTETIQQTWFSTGNAFCKAVLCLLASKKPKSFDTNGDVLLDNSNLKIASSRNYHHFFPKDYLKKKQPDQEANWIANIALIDAYSNKHKIAAKAPSAYITAFMSTNPRLKQGLRTHFIGDPDAFGVLNDDYQTFLSMRSEQIASNLRSKLNPEVM